MSVRRHERRFLFPSAVVLVLLALMVPAPPRYAVPGPLSLPSASGTDGSDAFRFSRLRYRSEGGYGQSFYQYDGRFWERWETDHPIADENFVSRLRELTTVPRASHTAVVDLAEDSIYDHPFLYLCDVGWMSVTAEEAARLGDHLRRGGFAWVDDFWGLAEWRALEAAFARALPAAVWEPLDETHPLLSTLFPLDRMPQIPARDFARWSPHDPPQIHRQPATGIERAELRALRDEDGRIVAVASFNSDIGDGWEREAYGEWFFEEFSSRAYAFGVNVVLYSLTH